MSEISGYFFTILKFTMSENSFLETEDSFVDFRSCKKTILSQFQDFYIPFLSRQETYHNYCLRMMEFMFPKETVKCPHFSSTLSRPI